MGKKTRKTRWRTLSINGHQSDSESQNGDSTRGYYAKHHPRSTDPWYQSNGTAQNKFNSTHSTPTRRHNYYSSKYESSKSTRSNSTASDTKITFNEDEYTRITTPRQDVLFKKGYLSKPKPYLQHLSQQARPQQPTGTSTGNSTGDGTPDHQSADGAEGTDVEYEQQSPFVFPSNYIDPNGIYFVNGFEPYPQMMVYNPPICYTSYVNHRVKRYSTDSMTESTSPSTEAQDQFVEGGEVLGAQEYNHVYGFVYPNYMYNGLLPASDVPETEPHSIDTKRLKKKRRRRKLSRSKTPNEGENDSTDEDFSSDDDSKPLAEVQPVATAQHTATVVVDNDRLDNTSPSASEHAAPPTTPNNSSAASSPDHPTLALAAETLTDSATETCINREPPTSMDQNAATNTDTTKSVKQCETETEVFDEKLETKTIYRVDAEEFVPRAYRHQHSFEAVPIPSFVPVSMYGPPTFVQGPLPINFIPGIPQSPYGYIPNQFFQDNERFYIKHEDSTAHVHENVDKATENNADAMGEPETKSPTNSVNSSKKDIDIAKIVSKLEEGACEQNKTDDAMLSTKKSADENTKAITEGPAEKTEKVVKKCTEKVTELATDKSPKMQKPLQKNNSTSKTDKTNNLKRFDKPSINTDISKPKQQAKYEHVKEPTYAKLTKPQTPASADPNLLKNGINIPSKQSHPTDISNSAPNISHYSEKLKQNKKMQISKSICPRFERIRKVTNNVDVKKVIKVEEVKQEPIKKYTEMKTIPVDQWIPVSSKKKRKNKINNDLEMVNNRVDTVDDDVQEEMDKMIETPTTEQPVQEEMKQESEVISKPEAKTKTEVNLIEPIKKDESISRETEKAELKVVETINKSVLQKEIHNEKREKNKGRRNKKRIIINDEQIVTHNENTKMQKNGSEMKGKLNMPCEDKTNNKISNESSNKESVISEKVTEIIANKEIVTKEDETVRVLDDKPNESQTKADTAKSKKKKRKSKTVKELSENINVSNPIDENYDFLSENVSLPDAELKTNVEVSQELDRMIQRGLYANLEEKIKSVNPSDKFINSVSTEAFPFDLLKPSAMEGGNKFGMLQHFNHFGILFNNTTMNKTLEKAVINKMTAEISTTIKQKKNFDQTVDNRSDVLTSENSVSKTTLPNSHETSPIPNGTMENISKSAAFPITRAVKEWMSRTREHTPEVEIFKDPNDIRNEFAIPTDSESSDNEFSTESEQKNVHGNPLHVACPENVDGTCVCTRVASKPRDSSQELGQQPALDEPHQNGYDSGTNTERVEEGEDALEVYESVYGANADTHKQMEASARQNRRLNYAKDGGLPYRAICCTVM